MFEDFNLQTSALDSSGGCFWEWVAQTSDIEEVRSVNSFQQIHPTAELLS